MAEGLLGSVLAGEEEAQTASTKAGAEAFAAAVAVMFALASINAPAAIGASSSDITTDIADVTRAACDAGHAYASRDLETLDRLTADDYSQTDVRGGVLKRLEWRDFVRNRKSVLTVECDNVEARFYGGAAVVTGGWT